MVIERVPMLGAMTRLVIGLATMVCLLAACSSPSDGGGDGPAGGDARAAKQEMDSLAEELLPDLAPVLGGEVTRMEAGFVERGGFGLWDYRARTQVVRPAPAEESLAEVQRVLEAHGLAVEAPGKTSDVTGTVGNVRVSVAWTAGDAVDVAELSMNTLEPASGDDDYAADAAPTDYAAYLR